MVLELLADPDLPAEIAWRLADELPDVLSREVSDGVAWEVRPAGTTTRPSPGWRARSPPSVAPLARGLESDAAVREAAYGYRQRERGNQRDH
jgi:hypothetical protein